LKHMKKAWILLTLLVGLYVGRAQTNFVFVTNVTPVTDLIAGAGCAWVDYDQDGYLDLFVANYAGSNRLYHNEHNGSFRALTNGAIVNEGPSESYGVAWGDFNNDGYPDLFVGNGYGSGKTNFFYSNNGNGTFTKITNSPVVGISGHFSGCAWADYDRDGFLDLFVGDNLTGVSVLYHNQAGNTFTRVGSVPTFTSDAVGVAWQDFNNDGWPDLLVANGYGTDFKQSFLYANLANSSFERVPAPSFSSGSLGSTGIAWGDYDNDGYPDVFITSCGNNSEPNQFFHNNGDGTFTRQTIGSIATDQSCSVSAAWGDYDNDGYLDLFVGNRGGSKNYLYHNNGNGSFEKITLGPIVSEAADNGGCTWGDYDNDGFLDLYVSNHGLNDSLGHGSLYHNTPNGNGWLKVKCVGYISNRLGIGAKVRVKATIGGKTFWQLREITSGDGIGSSGLIAHFGLGDAQSVEQVFIEWPSGRLQSFSSGEVHLNSLLTAEEGEQSLRFGQYSFQANEDEGEMVVTVHRDPAWAGKLTVEYATTSASVQTQPGSTPAVAGRDFVPITGSITFENGETTKTITVPILDNAVVDSNRIFGLVLTGTSPDASGGDGFAQLTINDNEIPTSQLDPSLPGVRFETAKILVGEDQGTADLVVQRTGDSTDALRIGYQTLDGSAKSGSEYEPGEGILEFAPLETKKSITIPVFHNPLVTSNKQFTVLLTNAPAGVSLAPESATETVTVYDADRPGGVDFSFDPSRAAWTGDIFISALCAQQDGKVLLGIIDIISVAGDGYNTLLRLNPDGSRDANFIPSIHSVPLPRDWGRIDALATQTGGEVLVAASVWSGSKVMRLAEDGTLDEAFNVSVSGNVASMTALADGSIILGGNFSKVGAIGRSGIARLTPNGQVDRSFDPGTGCDGPVAAALVQPDGRILIAGNFGMINGTSRGGIARLNVNGSVDASFNPSISSAFQAISLQTDGRILVAGASGELARLNVDGSLDRSFSSGAAITPLFGVSVAIQSDGRILLGGNHSNAPAGTFRPVLVRMNSDGSVDPSFDPGAEPDVDYWDSSMTYLALRTNGSVLFGSNLLNYDRPGLVLLHGDPALRLVAITPRLDTGTTLTVAVLPGRSYVLEASVDLQAWAPVTTNTASGYLLDLEDPGAPNLAQRFYRVVAH
jgi:uncharacterized delta-60 repeat protein